VLVLVIVAAAVRFMGGRDDDDEEDDFDNPDYVPSPNFLEIQKGSMSADEILNDLEGEGHEVQDDVIDVDDDDDDHRNTAIGGRFFGRQFSRQKRVEEVPPSEPATTMNRNVDIEFVSPSPDESGFGNDGFEVAWPQD